MGPQPVIRSPRREAGGTTAVALRWRVITLIALYVGFSFVVPFALNAKQSDLDLFFWPSAELAAHGHPFMEYAVRAGPYTDANGPLSLLPLTLLVVLIDALGWAADLQLRDAVVLAAFSGFSLLMAREGLRLVQMTSGYRSSPTVYLALCMSLPLWLALGSFGHIEIPLELWLTLAALRLLLKRRVAAAGALLGLVLLTRSAAVVSVLCLALLPLLDRELPSLLRRGLRSLALVAVAATTTIAGLLPFLVVDGHDVVTSLVTFRGTLPISGGSAWVLLARGLPWAGLIQHDDTLLFLVAALLLVGAALWRTRSEPVDVTRAAGLLTVAACCVPLLAKTTWSYYLVEPYVFAVIWTLSQPGPSSLRRWAVPILLSVVSVALAVTGLTTPPTTAQVGVGVAATVLLAVAIVIVLRGVGRIREASVPARINEPAPERRPVGAAPTAAANPRP
ncbi:MAG: hypothetical protein WCB85_09345 [Candidatus Dormiibacterota bacterium]